MEKEALEIFVGKIIGVTYSDNSSEQFIKARLEKLFNGSALFVHHDGKKQILNTESILRCRELL